MNTDVPVIQLVWEYLKEKGEGFTFTNYDLVSRFPDDIKNIIYPSVESLEKEGKVKRLIRDGKVLKLKRPGAKIAGIVFEVLDEIRHPREYRKKPVSHTKENKGRIKSPVLEEIPIIELGIREGNGEAKLHIQTLVNELSNEVQTVLSAMSNIMAISQLLTELDNSVKFDLNRIPNSTLVELLKYRRSIGLISDKDINGYSTR